ncbi:hypothetical protein [Acrocarpospora catenulata]|uniref:hypothetical protein n=1 Tax=Acrocarpospora catenulata TaxID=2836182 RepID=UPI001BDA8C2F|nr:hypothetical protein [Acrocarpospora catenulata]
MRALTAALLTLTIAACGSTEAAAPTPSAPATFTASGTVLAFGASWSNKEGEECGYTSRQSEDIKPGLRLVLSDNTGKTVGIGTLGVGILTLGDSPPETQRCVFHFSIADVPADSPFYGLKIGDRDPVDYSAAELRSGQLAIDTGA